MGNQYLFEFISLECRWFLENQIPAVFESYFENVPVDVRTDIYWTKDLKTDSNAINQGIKLREGRFEIKTKTDEYRHAQLPAVVQKWRKTGEEIPTNLNLQSNWLKIPKKRQLIRYLIQDGIPTQVSEYTSEGCNFELTHFGPPFEQYITIGFESYGPEKVLNENLLATYDKVRKKSGIEQIVSVQNAKSYPEWIAGLKEIWKS